MHDIVWGKQQSVIGKHEAAYIPYGETTSMEKV